MNAPRVDYDDIQGLVRFGYGPLTEARYVLARVRNAASAKAWLRSAEVASAVERPDAPRTALQIAFTAPGLLALGVSQAVVGQFSHEFVSGMTEPSRSRRLGDVGADAPSNWSWGTADRVPHVLVMAFAQSGGLDDFMRRTCASGWSDGYEELDRLDTGDLDQREPFGFADGISQPEIDWQQSRDPLAPNVEYGNVAALGEFLLGYRNEYGKYTDRPLVDAAAASDALPAAEDAPQMRDVGRNGTYLVMRQLRQDVRAFWQYAFEQAGSDMQRARALASAMVGRTPEGFPLVPIDERPRPGMQQKPDVIAKNRFTFDGDPIGVQCPLGAHIRRSNPRNADYVGARSGIDRLLATLGFGRRGYRDDLTSSVRFHRILRRGREYGDELAPEDALRPAPAGERERGLHFVCLNASIGRQFEFVQNAWTMNGRFSALGGENDPLIGNRDALLAAPRASRFTMPADGHVRRCVTGIPSFVTTRGGAYFFLPGLRALRYLAAADNA